MNKFKNPFSDEEMIYDKKKKRYILTEQFAANNGIDLGLELDASKLPEPSRAISLALDRVSFLVYSNIYSYGRQKKEKEFIMACNPIFRDVLRDAMLERLRYMLSSGDLSIRSGASISQGVRIETRDLIASVVEEMIFRPSGLLHRGDFRITENSNNYDY